MNVPILITAFCRPELTIQAVSSLTMLRPNSEIIVSQDGRIPGFYEEGHEITRRSLLKLAKNCPQVSLNLRDVNRGLTHHLIDVFRKLFDSHPAVIFLEEDMQICHTGLTFLEAIEGDFGMSHRTAYSTTTHPLGMKPLEYRVSYFPEQWGISINSKVYEKFVEEFKVKNIDRQTVRKIIQQSEFRRIKSECLADFWTELLRQEIKAPHGWDALLQWTLWKNKIPSKVSLESHVIDLGGDVGAITSRLKLETPQSSKLPHSKSKESFCIACEQQDAARRGFSTLSQLRARTHIRTRIKRLIETQKYK